MSLNNNTINQLTDERERAFKLFREMYGRLDKLIVAIYRPSLYTLREYEKIVREYRILQPKADRLEDRLRQRYPIKGIDKLLAWMKSNPTGDWIDEDNPDDEDPNWNEPDWEEPDWSEPEF